MQVTLIHNPAAGTEDQPDAEHIMALITDAGHSARYQSSQHADWPRVLDQPSDLLAIAGGDGIVGMVAARLVGKPIPVTILPTGTANNIASALNLKGRPLADLIAGWSDADRLRFDIGSAQGPWGSNYFFEGVGVGAFTDTMARLDARRNVDLAHHEQSEKKIQTALQIMKIRLEGCPAIPLKMTVDGRDQSGDYVLLEAMNIRSIGPNLCLAPQADPTDGVLDFVLVRNDERAQLDAFLSARLAGAPNGPTLSVVRGRHLHIECDETRLHLDDDVWPGQGEHPPFTPMIIDLTLHPEKLVVLVPR